MQLSDPDIQRYLDRVVSTLRDHLGPDLVGVYLHGSLAMGAFYPGRSDVDILAVCGGPLTDERRLSLGRTLAGIPRPGSHLEFSLVTGAAVRERSPAPAFEVHVSHEEPSVVDGSDREGDPDLVVHFAMARARGRALVGPRPGEVFPEPDRGPLLRAFLNDLVWAREGGAAAWEGHELPEIASMAYRVLNAARSWRYLETAELGSKVEGAAWLERREPDPDTRTVLDAALAYQRGEAPERPDEQVVDALVGRVENMLRGAIAGPPAV
jgi:predicted nucleotidyltransferase